MVGALFERNMQKYIRLPELLDELALSRGERMFKKVINQYKNVKLLILDEWLLTSLTEEEEIYLK